MLCQHRSFFLFCLSFFYIIAFPFFLMAEKLALTVNAEAAILMNAETGVILFEKEAHKPLYPASITKIVTAIYALQKVSDQLDVIIAADQDCIGTVTEEALRRSNYTLPAYLLIPDGSHIGIKKGEQLSLKDLFYGMLLASGDDAANVIAKYVGGTIPKFVEDMNAYIQQLGCQETTFYNPHGLHHPKQVTTAYDMAIITREALKNPLFREMVSAVRYMRPKTNKQEPTPLIQSNRLLRTGPYYYPKAIGVKTGNYSLAGNTFVAAAKDGDRTLIVVLLKAPTRKDIFIEAKKMFDAAFSQPRVQRLLLRGGPQKYTLNLSGAKNPIQTFITEDVTLEYYPAEAPKIKCLLYWDQTLRCPIAKHQQVGELVVQQENGQEIRKVPLFAQEEVKAKWFFSLKNKFSGPSIGSTFVKVLGGLAILLFVGFFLLQLRRR